MFATSALNLRALTRDSVVSRLNSTLKVALASAAAVCVPPGSASAEAVSPRELVEVADLANPVMSPDGGLVAFRLERASVERNTYDTIWYVQDTDGKSPPHRVAEGGVPLRDSAGIPLPSPAVWSPDGRWIYYRALIDGKIGVWRAAADGSRAEPVTADPADVRDFSLSADGKTLRYSVGATREEVAAAEQAEYDRGIRIDSSTPIGQNLFRSGLINGRLATQRYSKTWFDRGPLLADVPDRWKAIDLATGTARELPGSFVPPSPPSSTDLPKTIPEPWKVESEPGKGRIGLLTRVGDGEGLLQKPDVQLAMLSGADDRGPRVCRDRQCTGKAITRLQWRPDSDELLFTVTDPAHAQSIFRWNTRTGSVTPVARSPGLLSGGRDRRSDCAVSAEALVCVAAAADDPPRLERIDLATGRRTMLFAPNAALASDLASTTPARLLRWTDAKGHDFTGQLFEAHRNGGSPPPLFVTYYNCAGFLRGGVGDEWPLASLAENGISALCINAMPYRLDAVERYNLGLSAVRSVVDLLASKGKIDRTRVGMGGLSFGSEVTFWTEMNSDLLAAASVTSPGMSSNYYLFGSLKGQMYFDGLQKYWQLGTREATPDRWKLFLEESNIDKIQAPILMQMPEQEYIMALNYAIPLILAHRADLYVFPNEPHQKFQPKHKLAAYERNLDWFRFWLQGYEDPDPSKAAQYTHWREMRTAQADAGAARTM